MNNCTVDFLFFSSVQLTLKIVIFFVTKMFLFFAPTFFLVWKKIHAFLIFSNCFNLGVIKCFPAQENLKALKICFQKGFRVDHAFVYSNLDYFNSLFSCLNEDKQSILQMVQNVEARVVKHTDQRDHITPFLKSLHLLFLFFCFF